jgi:hypothetical protein
LSLMVGGAPAPGSTNRTLLLGFLRGRWFWWLWWFLVGPPWCTTPEKLKRQSSIRSLPPPSGEVVAMALWAGSGA